MSSSIRLLARVAAVNLLAFAALTPNAGADFPEDRPSHPASIVLPASGPDPDEDGVLASRDVCERTPGGARVLSDGCAAFEIVRAPELFTDPVADRVRKARQGLTATEALRDATRDVDTSLREASRQIVLGGHLVAFGGVCDGARTATEGARVLTAAETTMADVITALRAEIRRQPAEGEGGDADERDVEWHEYGHGYELVAAAVEAGNAAASALSRTCAAVAGPVDVRGRVLRTDDAAALLTLADGTLVALPRARELRRRRGDGRERRRLRRPHRVREGRPARRRDGRNVDRPQ